MHVDNMKVLTQLAEQYNAPIDDVKRTFDALFRLKPEERDLLSDIILLLAIEEE